MGDLRELLADRDGSEQPHSIAERWVKAILSEGDDEQVMRVVQATLQEVTTKALVPHDGQALPEEIIEFALPSDATRKAKDAALQALSPYKATEAPDGTVRLRRSDLLGFRSRRTRVPAMQVDLERQMVYLGLDSETDTRRTAPLPTPEVLDAALRNIEDYLATVDLGSSLYPKRAKMAMFEALLCILSAPFATELMKLKRRRFGQVDLRGPLFLFIHGPSHTGKSTFLTFALRLLTGRRWRLLGNDAFKKANIQSLGQTRTTFPLVFDDVVLSSKKGDLERVYKEYWEKWWSEERVFPAIIVSSNKLPTANDTWAFSRMRMLDFDVLFPDNAETKDHLKAVLEQPNDIFKWFSFLYLKELADQDVTDGDDLLAARRVFMKLYDQAHREVPACFPRQPIQELFDSGRTQWVDAIQLGKAEIRSWGRDRKRIIFAENYQSYEVNRFVAKLPARIKAKAQGNIVVVETPREFATWLRSGEDGLRQSWWQRLMVG